MRMYPDDRTMNQQDWADCVETLCADAYIERASRQAVHRWVMDGILVGMGEVRARYQALAMVFNSYELDAPTAWHSRVAAMLAIVPPEYFS